MLLFTLAIASFGLAQKHLEKKAAGILTDWMDLHCKLVRRTTGVAHVAYSRHFSYAAIAAYESMVKGYPSFRTLAGQLNGLSHLPASKETLFWPASLNAAYAGMLRTFYASFPICMSAIDSMETAQQQHFLQIPVSKNQLRKSTQHGKAVAAAILQWASGDGANSTKDYKPLQGEGIWKPSPTAAAPFWAENRSLTKDLEKIFSLKQPLYAADTTALFYQMANEVYAVSLNLTSDQKATALYWDDSPNGQYITVFGHWTRILSNLITQQQLPLIEAAAAYVKMTIALHEACILAWKGKYQYNVVRPVTYIQQHIAKDWTPLIATPPHPEFPAAHATLSNAAAIALCSLFGKECKMTDDSYTDIGMQARTYASLQEAAREAGLSRLYGGIHYRYSIEQGFTLGEETARHVDKAVRFRKN